MSNETTDSTFEADVLQSEIPVLVDFWAPWCGPCKILGPVMDNISEKAEGKYKVFKMNIDESPTATARYGITAIPTVILFRNGSVEKQFVGVQPEASYLKALE